MNKNRPDSHNTGLSLGDVYFILFRQKWIILAFFLLSILGAAVLLFVVKPPQYRSQAMISIPYVVEQKPLNAPGDEQTTRSLNEGSSSIINTEMATLYSHDLAEQVVRLLTPKTILGYAGATNVDQAAYVVTKGLAVEAIPDSSVIRITYENPDRALVKPILSEIIDAYLMKHAQLHQSVGVSDEFLTNETARLRAELAQTVNKLRKIKSAAGVISVEETQKGFAEQISTIRQNIFNTEAELAEHQAVAGELTKSLGTKPETTNTASVGNVPSNQIEKYEEICRLITLLKNKEQNYLTVQGFTPENVLVTQLHAQIDQNKSIKRSLEEKYPKLLTLSRSRSSSGLGGSLDPALDLATETEQVSALKAKIEVLNSQLSHVWVEASNFDNVSATISDLEQKKQVEQANLKYFMNNLEEARIDQGLGNDKAANISIIEGPTPPSKGWTKRFKKKVAVFVAFGVFGGLALAFLIEMFLDRSVKRPTDIETKLKLPLYISIPAVSRVDRRLLEGAKDLLLAGSGGNGPESTETQTSRAIAHNRQNSLRRFYEGLRDRLIVYFETRDLNHKPKLVTVTSCNKGAGVSSIAAGLAASLSETGDGKVLLVNISGAQGAAHQFYKGRLGYSLDEALAADKKQDALVKAYADLEQTNGDMLPANLPKKIAALMPRLKASDYDYIIFDMPPVSQTSVTARLSGLMDMVLLVIESERTNQDVVKRANQLLAESKATVSTVLNKTRNYVPRRLHQEYLDNA